jgi:hypothetical protein
LECRGYRAFTANLMLCAFSAGSLTRTRSNKRNTTFRTFAECAALSEKNFGPAGIGGLQHSGYPYSLRTGATSASSLDWSRFGALPALQAVPPGYSECQFSRAILRPDCGNLMAEGMVQDQKRDCSPRFPINPTTIGFHSYGAQNHIMSVLLRSCPATARQSHGCLKVRLAGEIRTSKCSHQMTTLL